jgi:recombinational DNA repair ATPase RecF
MTILQEIQRWSAELQAWQRDAVARLFANGSLSQQDEEDIYALLKAEYGIDDPKGRMAGALDASQVAAPAAGGKLIQIVALRDLKHVNALARNQKLQFAPAGLTVIYGDNGSGKSGYSRVLKRACRARDQSEAIHPDARLPVEQTGKAEAAFDVLIDGQITELKWTDGTVSPEELSSMAIFDTHCARAYLDEQGDFSYSPYGFDILGGLAKLCARMKQLADAEYATSAPNSAPFSHLSNQETAVGKAITSLSAKTKLQDIDALAKLSKEEIERHTTLDKTLKEENPKEKAALLRQRASRFESLASRIEEKAVIVSDHARDGLKAAIEMSKAAKQAAELAAKNFKETPGFLPGTGGEAWQALFEAARTYAAESHPQAVFPNLAPEDQCPLCQRPLADGAARLAAFDAFINDTTEKTAREMKAKAVAEYNAIVKVDLSVGLDKTLKEELQTADKELADACESFGKALSERAALIKMASAPEGDWNAVSSLPENPAAKLLTMVAALRSEADALEKAIDEKARAALVSEFKELDARLKLAPVKDAVFAAVAAHILQAKLAKCAAATKTTAISNKATELSEKVISKDLETALNDEFRRLNVRDLHVCLKPFSVKGKTYYKLALELPGQQRPMTILSEGEQRAIALASFLAEANLSGGRGGVAFDDPVSSLDHKRRWHVAQRLAEEAIKRQVVIFTHDLYFLCILQQEAKQIGVEMATLSIKRTSNGFGICSESIPFAGATCSKRVGMLRSMHTDVARLAKAGDDQAASKLTRDAYAMLRETWERSIEEVLFSGTIMRFSEGVSTQMLKEVEVSDDDYHAVTSGMTKCSKFSGHDGAASANVPTPPPDDLQADIEAFEAWRKNVVIRQKDVRERRKQ